MSRILAVILNASAGDFMLEPLADLAHRMEAPVTLLHVARANSATPASLLERDGKAIEEILAALRARGVDCTARTADSGEDISGTTLAIAQEIDATLLVVGIVGKSVFARSTRWGVPTELIRRTHIPVLLIPPGLDIHL